MTHCVGDRAVVGHLETDHHANRDSPTSDGGINNAWSRPWDGLPSNLSQDRNERKEEGPRGDPFAERNQVAFVICRRWLW